MFSSHLASAQNPKKMAFLLLFFSISLLLSPPSTTTAFPGFTEPPDTPPAIAAPPQDLAPESETVVAPPSPDVAPESPTLVAPPLPPSAPEESTPVLVPPPAELLPGSVPPSAAANGIGNLPFGKQSGAALSGEGPGYPAGQQLGLGGGQPLVDNTPYYSGSGRGRDGWSAMGLLLAALSVHGFVF